MCKQCPVVKGYLRVIAPAKATRQVETTQYEYPNVERAIEVGTEIAKKNSQIVVDIVDKDGNFIKHIEKEK